jgi:hypothetical protein
MPMVVKLEQICEAGATKGFRFFVSHAAMVHEMSSLPSEAQRRDGAVTWDETYVCIRVLEVSMAIPSKSLFTHERTNPDVIGGTHRPD